MTALLPTLTSVLAFLFAVMLLDQWLERRQGFQAVWCFGMLCYALGSGAEAIAAASGWSEPIYRVWYLTGAVWTAGWLGLGTAFLLARTRFGYTYAALLLLSGIVALMIRNSPTYAGAGPLPLLYLIGALILALAIGVETYFQNPPLPAPGYALSPTTGQPVGDAMPGYLRLLTPIMNIPGALSLLLGAVFSTYVFMPKRRVLPYSLDPDQPGDQFLFNLLASLPNAFRELIAGRLHSRVPATILIALGAFFPTITDSLNRVGSTELFQLGKFLGVVFLFAGFLVSVEVFREIRVPFTSIRLSTSRRDRAARRDAEVQDAELPRSHGVAAVTATVENAGAPASLSTTETRRTGLPPGR